MIEISLAPAKEEKLGGLRKREATSPAPEIKKPVFKPRRRFGKGPARTEKREKFSCKKIVHEAHKCDHKVQKEKKMNRHEKESVLDQVAAKNRKGQWVSKKLKAQCKRVQKENNVMKPKESFERLLRAVIKIQAELDELSQMQRLQVAEMASKRRFKEKKNKLDNEVSEGNITSAVWRCPSSLPKHKVAKKVGGKRHRSKLGKASPEECERNKKEREKTSPRIARCQQVGRIAQATKHIKMSRSECKRRHGKDFERRFWSSMQNYGGNLNDEGCSWCHARGHSKPACPNVYVSNSR